MPTRAVRCTVVLALFLLSSGVLSACRGGQVHDLTILHINDLHARFLPDYKGEGGFAHLVTALREEKAKSKAHLTLHGGDFVQGTPVSTMFEGVPVFEVANRLGIDVNCLGNHEFDYGWEKIAEYLRISEFENVCANVINDHGERLIPLPYVVRSVGGLRVALIGALTEALPSLTTSDKMGPWRAAPIVETLRPHVERAGREADLLIVLGHLLLEEHERILRGLPEVAVVVSGHNHTGRETVLDIDGRIAVNALGYGREIGRLEIRFDKRERRLVSYDWKRIPVTVDRYPADPEMKQIVDSWEAKVSPIVDVAIGRAEKSFDRREVRALMEQAMADATGAELAYMNTGGVRDTIPEGALLARHIWNVMPFDNKIVTARILGSELPKEFVEGRKVEGSRLYVVATNNYSAKTWADQGRDYGFPADGPLLRDVLIEWIRKRGVLR